MTQVPRICGRRTAVGLFLIALAQVIATKVELVRLMLSVASLHAIEESRTTDWVHAFGPQALELACSAMGVQTTI